MDRTINYESGIMKEDKKYTFDAGDEQLLVHLFAEAASTEVADDGFTAAVVGQLPSAAGRTTRLWTCLCGGVGLLLAVVFRAWEYAVDALAWCVGLLHDDLFRHALLLAPVVMCVAIMGVVGTCVYLAIGELRGRTDSLAVLDF